MKILFILFFIFQSIVILAQEDAAVQALDEVALPTTEEKTAEVPKPEIEQEELEIAVGIDKLITLDFEFNTNLIFGIPGLIKAKIIPNKRQILLTGAKQGKTSLAIYDKAGDIKKQYIITVSQDEKTKIVANLKELIGDFEGIKIDIKGEQVVVSGQMVRPEDVAKVTYILEGFKDKGIINLIELSDQAQVEIAKIMRKELIQNGYRDVTVRVVNKTFWLEGAVDSDASRKGAEAIVDALLTDKWTTLVQRSAESAPIERNLINNFITVNPQKEKPVPIPKQVKITAQFVELSKEYAKSFGFKWAPSLNSNQDASIRIGTTTTDSGTISSQSSGGISAVISNLFPKLETAKGAGYAKIIQSGFVITKEKEEGTINRTSTDLFSVGTSFNPPATATTGFSMAVTPTLLREENIELGIGVNVSLSAGKNSAGNPLTTTNSVKQRIIVKNNESAAIGGIVQNSNNTGYDNDPSGGSNNQETGSPLFNFIRSKSFRTAKKQFVIFVTPEIIESASEGTEEVRKKFRRRGK